MMALNCTENQYKHISKLNTLPATLIDIINLKAGMGSPKIYLCMKIISIQDMLSISVDTSITKMLDDHTI